METFIQSAVVLVNWTLPNFFNKESLKIIGPRDLTINQRIIGGLISLGVLMFLGKNYNFETNKKTYGKTLIFVILSIIAYLMYYNLLQKYNVSDLTVILNPINIILTAFVGSMFFKEVVTTQMWVGIFVIVSGLIVFLKGKPPIK